MNVKLKIISWDTRTRSFLVNVYTDKLEQYMPPIWERRAAELIASRLAFTQEEAMTKAQEMDRPGIVTNISIFDDPVPTGDALYTQLLQRAVGNGFWLVQLEKCSDVPVDKSSEVRVVKNCSITTDVDGKLVYLVLP